MKRLVIFLLILITFVGIYNFPALRASVSGFFGDTSYQKNDLLNAEKRYTDIIGSDSGSTLLKADTLYNLGNTLYRLGEKEQDGSRMKLWEESIGNYVKSLSIRTDKETEENLAFVQEKLKIEQEKQEEKKKQEEEQKKEETEEKTASGSTRKQDPSGEKNNEEKTGTGQQNDLEKGQQWKEPGAKKNTEWSESGNKPQSWRNWSNGGSYNPIGWQSKDDIDSKLSPADRQEVEKYIEELKKFGKQNGKFLNPEKWGEIGGLSDQIRNFFGNDSFFQDVIPTNDGKKDW